MLSRMLVIIALAIAVSFGVFKAAEQENVSHIAMQSGRQLDAALGRDPDLLASERWYDSPVSIGLIAGGTVFVVGVVVVAIMKPNVP